MRVLLVVLAFALWSSNGAFARDRLDLHLAFGYRTPLYGSLAERMVAGLTQRSGGALRLS